MPEKRQFRAKLLKNQSGISVALLNWRESGNFQPGYIISVLRGEINRKTCETMMVNNELHYIDSLLPNEMAVRAEKIGARKALMNFTRLFVLSVLAGTFIAFGAILATTVAAGAEGMLPFGVIRLLSGFVFSIGLILVIIGGAELFTGNNLIVMAWANRRITTFQVLRNWTIVYLGNFVGAFGTALMMFLSGQHLFGNSVVGITALSIADAKTNLGFGQAVILGIFCNLLVCLAVWMSFSGRTATDKVLVIIPPITAFVACGFENVIANMYYIPFALLIKAGAAESFWAQIGKTAGDYPSLTEQQFFFNNLLPVTIGNIIGGAVLVGIVYWFVYLRKRHQK
jgi:formate transporter